MSCSFGPMPSGSSSFRAGPVPVSQIIWLTLFVILTAGFAHAADKITIKVIVLSGFEVGDDTGDAPGEFQYWAEREHLTGTLEVPGAPHPLRYNTDGLYASVAGNTRDHTLTTVTASELIMALSLDPQLDLRKTYWIINGISGIDPAHGSIGSAVWAEHVVDGDAMREVGEAEMPANWTYGLFAIGTSAPNTLPQTTPTPAVGAARLSLTPWTTR
jgi:purine nucleoside permease